MKRHPASASLSLLRLGPGDVALGVAGLNSLEIGPRGRARDEQHHTDRDERQGGIQLVE